MRLGELLALEWNDIDLDIGKATISKSFRAGVLGTPKNGKQRIVDLSPQVVHVLKAKRRENRLTAMKEGRKPFEIVFFKNNGDHTSQNTTRGVWRALLKRSGLRYRKFHGIRHTVASLMVAAGVPVTDIQATLGHHSAAFTLDVYGQSVKRETAKTAVLDSISLGMLGNPADSLSVFESLYSCLPVSCRTEVSFSTGLYFSDCRPVKVADLSSAPHAVAQDSMHGNVLVFDVDQYVPFFLSHFL